MMLQLKCQGSNLSLMVSGQVSPNFLIFYLENLFLTCVTEICNGSEPFSTILKEGHTIIIPVKFSQNLARGEAFVDDGRLTTHDGHPMITTAHLSKIICKQTVETLIRCRVLWRLIWVYTVCLCPTKRTLSFNGLNKIQLTKLFNLLFRDRVYQTESSILIQTMTLHSDQ